jgi:hypothetical protein
MCSWKLWPYVTDDPVCCTSLRRLTKSCEKVLLMGKSITKSLYSIFSLRVPMPSSADHCRTTTRGEVSNMWLNSTELLNVRRGILRNCVCVVYPLTHHRGIHLSSVILYKVTFVYLPCPWAYLRPSFTKLGKGVYADPGIALEGFISMRLNLVKVKVIEGQRSNFFLKWSRFAPNFPHICSMYVDSRLARSDLASTLLFTRKLSPKEGNHVFDSIALFVFVPTGTNF